MSNANRIYERSTKASLYNENKIEFVHEPMFLGAGRNTQRFESLKYDYFDKSNDEQQGFDWKHDEISLIKDIKDFKGPMTIAERFVVTRTFQKLIFLDSLNGRGPFLTLGQIATLPELECVILTWNHFEANKHSRTYTEELRALYDNPSEIFDESFNLPELTKISSSIRKPFERAYFNIIGYIYNIQRDIEITEEQLEELKISIVMLCIEINSLEGIRFYSGFAAVWALTEGQKYIPGTSENLSLICRDENTHLALTQNILKNLRRKENEGFIDTYKKCMPDIEKRYIEVYNEELEWIDYLFSQGSYIGMNSNILKQYLTYITIRRMKGIGIKVTKEMLSGNWCEKNPLPWIDKYINMDLVEKLPQEEKVLNYVTGGVDQDIDVDNEHILAKEILGDLF